MSRELQQRRDLPVSLKTRADGTPIETLSVRAEGDQMRSLVGYGAVFYRENEPGSEFWLWDDFVERIMPGAFDRALKEDDVRAFFNHDANQVLGRRRFSSDDSLKLTVDEVGLRYEIGFDESDPDHQKVFSKVRSGKVSGSSFMFIPTAETYRSETDSETKKRIDIVEVTEVRLFEVGPVVFPAYDATTSELRRRMSGDLTQREREARDRRASQGDSERLRLFRHRVEVESALRSL